MTAVSPRLIWIGFADWRDAFVCKPLHFLLVMDQRPSERTGLACGNGLFDHLDRTLNAEAKTVFVCKQDFHYFNLTLPVHAVSIQMSRGQVPLL
jgi:hypothetical protein